MLMNDVLEVTWLVLFVAGVLSQTLTPMAYNQRNPNQYAAIISILLLGNAMAVATFTYSLALNLILLFVTAFYALNAWVLVLWRFHPLRTRAQVVRSGVVISAVLLVLVATYTFGALSLSVLMPISLAINTAVFWRVYQRLRSSRMRVDSIKKTPHALPAVSIAVPARNETHALTQNIRSILKTDYEKLEILVADDCSQDNTAQIIRSFAHDGVRFVQGQSPHDAWIGKNMTYQLLADESSADYIIFSGVDTRYEAHTVAQMIGYMETHKLSMLSLLPQHKKLVSWSLLLQPLRYLLVLVASTRHNPPVLSTVWIIKRVELQRLGGLAAVENSIIPESYFARELAHKNAYKFAVAPPELGLSTFKKPSSQRDTAIRYLYSRMRKNVGLVAVWLLLASLSVVLPFVAVFWFALSSTLSQTAILALLSFFAIALAHSFIIAAGYDPKLALLSPFHVVAGGVAVMGLSLISMVLYELDRVRWKGRDVCYPVMLNRMHKD